MVQAHGSYIDLAQIVLYMFWIFFAGLIFYLHRENKREGYPLETERAPGSRIAVRGFPEVPNKKVFHSHDGTTKVVPKPTATTARMRRWRRWPNGRARRSCRPATRWKRASARPPGPTARTRPNSASTASR